MNKHNALRAISAVPLDAAGAASAADRTNSATVIPIADANSSGLHMDQEAKMESGKA